MLKVIHISTAKTWRGGEQQLSFLLENKNIDQQLVCINNSALHEYALKNNYEVQTIEHSYSLLQLKKIITAFNPDFIHVHDSKAHTLAYLISILFDKKIKIIVHRRVVIPPSSNWLTKQKYNSKNVEKIICISHAVQKEMEKIINEKEKLSVVYSGVDIKKFEINHHQKLQLKEQLYQQYSITKTDKLIGIVAALKPEKNIEEFLEIAKNCTKQNENTCFIIAGEGELLERYQEKYKQENIKFIGFQKDMLVFYAALDVFLFTSKQEGLGSSILEAMATGTPIISANFDAAKEIIENEKNGFIYTNISDAVKKLKLLINNEETINLMIKNATSSLQKFDKEIMKQKIMDIYLSLYTKQQ